MKWMSMAIALLSVVLASCTLQNQRECAQASIAVAESRERYYELANNYESLKQSKGEQHPEVQRAKNLTESRLQAVAAAQVWQTAACPR